MKVEDHAPELDGAVMVSFEEWISPWLGPALIAILTAAFSAYFTLRSNIRQKAWLVVYAEKRSEIRDLITALDTFASTVVTACEVVALETRPAADQLTWIAFFIRRRFGPNAEQKDPLVREIMQVLPPISPVAIRSSEVEEKLRYARRALVNSLDVEMQDLNLRVARLLTTLSLSIRNPDLIPMAHEPMSSAYQRIHSTTPAYAGFDADKFAEEWAKSMTPLKLGLREDLEKSGRSLGAATRVSWGWRLRRSRLWKFLATKRAS